MKRTLWITLGLGLAALVGWGGRAAWRAHKDIVTLHVRNEPVGKVVRAIERQTRETIVWDRNLTNCVTLDLDNVPLRAALDQLAAKAGALAETVHAVYRSQPALLRLERALQAGADGSQVGWTNIAPQWAGVLGSTLTGGPPHSVSARALDSADLPESVKAALRSGRVSQPGVAFAFSTNVAVSGKSFAGPGGPVFGAQKGGMRMINGSPVVMMQSRTGSGPGGTQTSLWSPERITLQASLSPQLGPDAPQAPTRAGAEAVARKLAGRCTTLYALKQAPLGLPRFGFGPGGGGMSFQASTNGLTNGMLSMDQLGARMQRDKLAQFEELTPEERAQRARRLRAAKPN